MIFVSQVGFHGWVINKCFGIRIYMEHPWNDHKGIAKEFKWIEQVGWFPDLFFHNSIEMY